MKPLNNMFPARKNYRYLFLSVGVFLVLLAIYVGAFFLLRDRSQAAQAANQRAQRAALVAAQQSQLADLLENTAEERQQVDSFFVSADGVADFISTVEDTAEQTRVTTEISNIAITNQGDESDGDQSSSDEQATDENGPLLETLTLDIRATGSWPRVMHFVRTLELLPMQITISTVSIERVVNETDTSEVRPVWRAVMTVKVTKLSA